MNRIRKSLITISVLTFFYGLYYWGIPAVINIDKRMDFIEEQVLTRTGVKISVNKPRIKMGLTPSVWFMAENVAVLNPNNTEALNINHSAIKIYLLPLIAGKIQIGNFSIDSIKADFVYDKNGNLYLGSYLFPKDKQTDMTLDKAFFRIGNYCINLDDKKQNKKLKLNGSYLSLDEFKKGKRLKLSTNANLYTDKKTSEIMADIDIKLPINRITENQFKINGHISNLDLSDFSEYASSFPNSKIKSLSGIINLATGTTTKSDNHKNIFTKLSVKNLGIMQEDIAKSIYCKDTLTLSVDADTIKDGINIRNAKLTSDGINIISRGKVTKLDSKLPNVDMNIAINNSRTEKFIPLLPGEEELIYEANLYTLKKNYFYGDINGNLNIKGRADTPDVTGKILVTNGYLNKPIPDGAGKATIKLDFKGNKLSMDVKVPASYSETVYVTGEAELYGKRYADLLIKSTPNVKLKTAQIVLNPLHEILKFDLGPVPIMDISGIGNIDLHIMGTRKEPHAWGEFNFRNTTASFLDIHNLILKNGNGKLTFNDLDTHFLTDSAYINGKPVTIDGKCNLYGVLDFDVTAKNQNLGDLLKIINTSPMLKDIQKLVAPINHAGGSADAVLKLTGQVKDINDIVFNKNIFAKGNLDLHSANIKAMGVPLSDIKGKIHFENLKTNFNITSNLETSELKISGNLDEENGKVKISSDRFILKDGLKILNLSIPYRNDIGKIHTAFTANYNGSISTPDISNITASGKIFASKGQYITINNATFHLAGGMLKLSPLKGYYKTSPYTINFSIANLFKPNQSINGYFDISNFNLNNIYDFRNYLPKQFNDINELTGSVNLKGQIKENKIYADTNVNDINFTYKPQNLKIKIKNGNVQLKDETLALNKISTQFGEMPVFIDGKIYNISSKTPVTDLYINAKPTQEFIDSFFNKKALYPIKTKGEINYTANLHGPVNALRNKTKLTLSDNSNIYYMGATLGGNLPVIITTDGVIYPNGIKLNNLQYDKLIPASNGKLYPQTQLNASGNIAFLDNNDLKFNNFKVKTKQPTDAKIFNIIFRKPLMKEGIFTSNITIDGKASAPLIIGKLNITGINVPLFDAIIKDVDFNFQHDKIYLKSKGVVLTNNLDISAILRNHTLPKIIFDEINFKVEDLDLNKITETIRDYDAENSRTHTAQKNAVLPDLSNITVKKAYVSADNIKIKNINATEFFSELGLNEKMLVDVKTYRFKIAEGLVYGDIKYNLLSNLVNFNMNVANANAQMISEALFNLKGQIYGSLTGSVNLYCNGKSQDLCTSTLTGKGEFNVTKGRMPKLGSLEYLLKAGNLVKGGITGLSINGIIDLITPMKTGEFDSIKGDFHIESGIANDIQIFSAGKDLNMYLNGSYNLNNLIADMHIFGALSKNFSTLFGKIGNASLNTLFNTIPGINVSEAPTIITEDIRKIPNIQEDASRVFTAEIYGDINGSDYVKSFKWLK